MNKFISSSLFMKILSVIFAVFIWFVALNSENPLNIKSVTVSLDQKNSYALAEKNLGLYKTVIPQYITVTIHGRDEALKNVTGSDFEAAIDFSGIEKSGVYNLSVVVENNNDGIYINDISQKLVKVTVEEIIKKTFEVGLKKEGTLKENYFITNAFLSPDIIEVEGLKPDIDEINSVVAPLHYENLSENISTLINCHFYDRDGNEITKQSGKFSVSANVDIAREVPVIPVVTGKPQKYYFVESQKVTPAKVLVQGSSAVLNELDRVNISPVSIEGANDNINVPVALNLPEGVSIYDPDQEITLSIILKKLTEADYHISKERITIIFTESKYKYEIKNSEITIKLLGVEENKELSREQIIPSVNVKGLGPGVHELPVKILVPQGIFVDGEYFVTVEILGNTDNAGPEDNGTTFIPR